MEGGALRIAPLLWSAAFARSSRNLSNSERHNCCCYRRVFFVCVCVCEHMTSQEVIDNYERLFLHYNGGNERRRYLHWTLPLSLKTALPANTINTKIISYFIKHHFFFFFFKLQNTFCRDTCFLSPYHTIPICQYHSAQSFSLVASERKSNQERDKVTQVFKLRLHS